MGGSQGLSGWKWIFIITAVLYIIFGLATYFILPSFSDFTEKNAKSFLNGREQGIVMLMAMISYFIAYVWSLMNVLDSNLKVERGYHMMVSGFILVLGFIHILALGDTSATGVFVAAAIALCVCLGIVAPLTSWSLSSFGGRTRRSVSIALIIPIRHIGGIIGYIFPTSYKVSRDILFHLTMVHCIGMKVNTVCLVLMVVCVIMSGYMKYTLHRINKKRDNMTPEEFRIGNEGIELGEKILSYNGITM
ncbi:hypothetical protein BDA99DRAFT_537825 [Phascolomyces articulosus]|uniref:Uncharacterized protein n=1 Tax=Phascolomyces articulosus TaxID=60185 RepID=A0AAD5JZ48_9FUNG|nr:hypothetical protein BDA99DRAFT_537825 [Phascolomyces articulosus]